LATFLQPSLALQESTVHSLRSSHDLALPTQLPSRHFSFSVQGLPSAHEVPLASVFLQPFPGSQLSVVQALPSSQLTG
jgi:hypothetical protein